MRITEGIVCLPATQVHRKSSRTSGEIGRKIRQICVKQSPCGEICFLPGTSIPVGILSTDLYEIKGGE